MVNLNNMKTLEERKKEFEHKFNEVFNRMYYLEIIPDIQSRINERIPDGGFNLFQSDELWSWITDNFVPKSTILQTKQKLIEECICNEWDGKGISTCGFPCPVHNKNFKNNKIHKEGFDAGYKKGYKDGLKNVSGWSKEYEKMMLENL